MSADRGMIAYQGRPIYPRELRKFLGGICPGTLRKYMSEGKIRPFCVQLNGSWHRYWHRDVLAADGFVLPELAPAELPTGMASIVECMLTVLRDQKLIGNAPQAQRQ